MSYEINKEASRIPFQIVNVVIEQNNSDSLLICHTYVEGVFYFYLNPCAR